MHTDSEEESKSILCTLNIGKLPEFNVDTKHWVFIWRAFGTVFQGECQWEWMKQMCFDYFGG